ncbi:hypothetical protein CLV97_11616 [Planifilum fimeticola]|uniref:Uncharacterized protein n=1 Tax=Planifilum fimeticola TaxID=201975 RepID=A0A2T0LDI4_9BACL|nr:hypothetical protein CLV97_11616 [Planifilum fimeticola]
MFIDLCHFAENCRRAGRSGPVSLRAFRRGGILSSGAVGGRFRAMDCGGRGVQLPDDISKHCEVRADHFSDPPADIT